MKNPTLTEIRKSVEAAGGTYKKLNVYLNKKPAYEVNGVTMNKEKMIELYMLGEL